MRRISMLFLAVALRAACSDAPAATSDSQTTQAMLTEIRELRQDLQNLAATIQRVAIVVYRHQGQAAMLDRVEQRLENARSMCKNAEANQKQTAHQIEETEKKLRNSQGPSDETRQEDWLANLKSSAEIFSVQAQQCQAEQIDAEAQYRTEQAKMNELENQLDQLDRALAAREK